MDIPCANIKIRMQTFYRDIFCKSYRQKQRNENLDRRSCNKRFDQINCKRFDVESRPIYHLFSLAILLQLPSSDLSCFNNTILGRGRVFKFLFFFICFDLLIFNTVFQQIYLYYKVQVRTHSNSSIWSALSRWSLVSGQVATQVAQAIKLKQIAFSRPAFQLRSQICCPFITTLQLDKPGLDLAGLDPVPPGVALACYHLPALSASFII